jgi:iron complex transport system ATP-binding protein
MNAVLSREHEQLAAIELSVRVPHRALVNNLNIEFELGSITTILGRNGAGKTLTLHTLAGLRAPASGRVLLGQQQLTELPRRTLARSLGLLTQTTEDAFPSSAIEAVLVGRHPHIGFWEWEGEQDRRLAQEALASVHLAGCAGREVSTLSGGERRRVALAALLAQTPETYLLDEPINHLDPHHQIDILNLLRTKADEGRCVIMTLHDPALAARYSDHTLLLFGDGTWEYGLSEQILNEETLSRLYGLAVREVQFSGGRTFVMGSGRSAGDAMRE